MNRLDEQYRGLLGEILYNGVEKTDRTGTGTLSKFGLQIKHNMSDGFPILTTKKVFWKGVVEELKWFLKGDTYAKTLADKGVHIWDQDAERNGREDTYLGPIYGHQWRKLSQYGVQKDQIKILIEGLRENPDSRRHLVDSWNVMDLDHMVLPPCHYSFQCYVSSGKLSLLWNQRSVDVGLGLSFNISSYGLLLHLLCHETGYEPGELIGNFGDTHIYKNHVEPLKEQMTREPRKLPQLKLSNVDTLNAEFDAELIGYDPHLAIKMKLST